MSKISHILLKNPVIVPTGTTLAEAARLMKENKAASVLVSRKQKLAGIVSMEDVVQCVANGKLDIEVGEVMHAPELTIDADKWLTDALEIFRRCNVSHAAVVENGEKIGIIRAEDILHTYRFGSA
jgi:CBS domain-containing protein